MEKHRRLPHGRRKDPPVPFLVGMDKVKRSSGSGSVMPKGSLWNPAVSAPPAISSRSAGSSSATPRTGRGTARSSDGKGTPRDCERHVLGTRPRAREPQIEVLPQTPIEQSPLSTGRSGGSSRQESSRSHPLSSRSLRAERERLREPLLEERYEWLAQSDTPVRPPVRPAWLADISRELEVMRHVIVKENASIKEQYEVEKNNLDKFRQDVDQEMARSRSVSVESASGSVPGTPATPSLPSRVVDIGFVGLDVARARELGQRDHRTFELPEYPGVKFKLSFGARRAGVADVCGGVAPVNSDDSCAMRLRVSGPGSKHFVLRVKTEAFAVSSDSTRIPLAALPVAVDRRPAVAGESGFGAPARNADEPRLGMHGTAVIQGGGSTTTFCAWPPVQVGGTYVVCRATISPAGCAGFACAPSWM